MQVFAYVFVFVPWAIGMGWLLRRAFRALAWLARATGDGMRDAHAQVYRPMLGR